MKYIMIEQLIGGVRVNTPVVFPNRLVHADVAEALAPLLHKMNPGSTIKVVSAGDVSMSTLCTSGKSTTLNLDSRPQDGQLIQFNDYML